MADKKTHFGRAGEFYAMSELLLRGWNVAVPVVDLGDDVFVIDDRDKTTLRVQVKSAEAEVVSKDDDRWKASFNLSREQLRTLQEIELYYMFLVRFSAGWKFLWIPRPELLMIRTSMLQTPRRGPGRPSIADDEAKSDALGLTVTIENDAAWGWSADLRRFFNCWPDALRGVVGGPGTARAGRSAPTPPSEEGPAR